MVCGQQAKRAKAKAVPAAATGVYGAKNRDSSNTSSRPSGLLTNKPTTEWYKQTLKVPSQNKMPPLKGPVAMKRKPRNSTGGKHFEKLPKTPTGGVTKTLPKIPQKIRYRPSMLALQQIRPFQQGASSLVPQLPFATLMKVYMMEVRRLPFARLVKEIASKYVMKVSFQSAALMAVQEAAVAYIIQFSEDRVLRALLSRRLTIISKEIPLARRIRGEAETFETTKPLDKKIPKK
jgi:histone H3